MFTQLHPQIPVTVEGKGKGWAFAVIDYSQEHDLYWVVALDAGGEIWCSRNERVRVQPNWTLGREKNDERPVDGGRRCPLKRRPCFGELCSDWDWCNLRR